MGQNEVSFQALLASNSADSGLVRGAVGTGSRGSAMRGARPIARGLVVRHAFIPNHRAASYNFSGIEG